MAISDLNTLSINKPATKAFSITPHDSTNLTTPTRGLLVATAGNYTILLLDDSTAVQMYLAAGIVHPLQVLRVNSTNAASTSGVVGYR